MTNLLLLLILTAVIAIAFILDSIGKRLPSTDLTKEDEAVKLSTEEVEAAKQRIPSDKQPTK